MSLRALWSRLLGSVRRRGALDREMERELAFHLEMATRRNLERGMAPEAAARQARLSFGSMEATREEAREAHRARLLENVGSDLRFALRSLRRAPSFALATILTMALGIGASTAIFSVVDAVLLKPLPIPQPEDFAYLGWVWTKGDDVPSLTAFQYQFVREQSRSFAAVATYHTQEARLGSDKSATPVRGLSVSGAFFQTIGFVPRLGRAFDREELERGDRPVVILGDGVWRTSFGADPNIVGRPILLDGEPRTVVGVMPAAFRFPPAVDHAGYLVPFAVHADPGDEGHNTEALARLRHGTSPAERAAELTLLSRRFATAYPGLADPREAFRLYRHRDVYVGGIRRTLWVLFGAVSLLLLIACANTAALLLVRAAAREREIAVRTSIGAGPRRILQQLLTEGAVLAFLSAGLGIVLGVVALRAFLATAPAVLPSGMAPRLDGRALGYAIGLAVVTGLIFGLAAALPSFRVRLQSALVSGSRGATGGRTRARELLVLLETASAVVLLAGATLLTASFARLMSVDPGFDAEHVMAVRLGRLPAGYDPARQSQLIDRLLERVRRIPGVEQAAAAPNLPLERGTNFPVDTPDHPELAIGGTELRVVSPGYFQTLGSALAGRDFNPADAHGESVAIVNRAFAQHFWPGESPLNRVIQIGHFKDRWLGATRQTRVIGVADDMHEIGLDRKPRPTVLLPRSSDFGERTSVLLVRGVPAQVAASLRREVLAEEAQLAPQIEPLAAVVSKSVAGPRFRTLLIGAFAGSALLLAAIGIYGVIAAVVEQRRREIGIRLSLGATRGAVARSVTRRCLLAVSAGAGIGLLAFWALRRSLSSMLYGTSTGDPRLLGVALAVLALVAMLAAWIPARRASRVDPAITLRLD